MTHPKKSKCSTPTPDLDAPHLSAARADIVERMERMARVASQGHEYCCPGTECVCCVDGPKESCLFYQLGVMEQEAALDAAVSGRTSGLMQRAREQWDRAYGHRNYL